jgi:hypothetical protein
MSGLNKGRHTRREVRLRAHELRIGPADAQTGPTGRVALVRTGANRHSNHVGRNHAKVADNVLRGATNKVGRVPCPQRKTPRRPKRRKCGGKATAMAPVACFDPQRGALLQEPRHGCSDRFCRNRRCCRRLRHRAVARRGMGDARFLRGPGGARPASAERNAPRPTKGDANPGGDPRVVQGSAKRGPRMLCHVDARGARGAPIRIRAICRRDRAHGTGPTLR